MTSSLQFSDGCIAKAWGYSGPHGLFKRGKDLNNDDPNDVARLLANIKVSIASISSMSDTLQRLGVTLGPTDCSNAGKTQMTKIPMRKFLDSWKR